MEDNQNFRAGDMIAWRTPYGRREMGQIESFEGHGSSKAVVKLFRGPVVKVVLVDLQRLSLLDVDLQRLSLLDIIAIEARELGDSEELG